LNSREKAFTWEEVNTLKASDSNINGLIFLNFFLQLQVNRYSARMRRTNPLWSHLVIDSDAENKRALMKNC